MAAVARSALHRTYIISKVVRERGIVVALSGLGGDELFGGYASFSRVPQMMKMLRRLRWMPAWGRSAVATLATATRPQAVRHKAVDMMQTGGDPLKLYLNSRRIMSDRQLAALGIEVQASGTYLPAGATGDLPLSGRDMTYDVSLLESRLYMGNMLLRDSDTNGMAHSLEIRVPMLDRRLIDYAYALPGSVRLPAGKADKHLLRRAFAPELRPALTGQQKRGFTLPIGEWIRGPLRELCEDGISHLKSTGILRPEGIDLVWNSFLGQSDQIRWARALGLCVLGLCCKRLRQAAAVN
jgi:asparagine synthase (glutamine-hydrolysing)